jgi:hypothetical protein
MLLNEIPYQGVIDIARKVEVQTMGGTKYKLQKLANRKTGFPIATIAYYGPNNQFASKAVVGIILAEKEKEPVSMKKWLATEKDVRLDEAVSQEILEFIAPFKPRRVAMVDGIIGCPHEEGIDYPMGETCPQCPYWAGRDRLSGAFITD